MFAHKFLLVFLVQLLSAVLANKETIGHKYEQVCSGMYSKQDFHGKVDPFISFDLKKVQQ